MRRRISRNNRYVAINVFLSRRLNARMKEEGEITDDDEDINGGSETPMSQAETARLRRKRGASNRGRHSAGIHGDLARSRDRSSSRSRDHSASVSSSRESSSPVPVKKVKSYSEARVDSGTSIAFSSKLFTSSPLVLSSYPESEHLRPLHFHGAQSITDNSEFPYSSNQNDLHRFSASQDSKSSSTHRIGVSQSISGSSEFPKRSSQDRFSISDDSQGSGSHKVDDVGDTNVTTIDDSDGEIFEDVGTNLDEDLDELQLRREALDSAVKYNRNKNSSSALFGGNLVGSSNPITQLFEPMVLLSSGVSDVHCVRGSVETGIESHSLHASNGSTIGRVVDPLSTGSGDQPASDTLHSSQDFAPSNQHNSVIPSHSFLIIESTYRNNSVAISSPASPLDQDMCPSDVDNYDAVDMELDSGNSSDSPVVCAQTSNTPQPNCSQDQVSLESSTMATYSVPLPPKTSDNIVSQSAVLHPTVDDRNNVVAKYVSGGTAPGEKTPNPMPAKTRMVDSCNNFSTDNLEPQRKVEDAEKKSELLLREAVLRSLSSKRQQQQQSQLETSAAQDRVKVSNVQVAAQSLKRTITVASNSLLPVHQPVVISLTEESSDSNDELEVEDFSNKESKTTASSNIFSNLDRVLREIRRATEASKPEDSGALSSGLQAEPPTAVNYQEKLRSSSSTSETTSVANKHHVLPNKAPTLLPLPAPLVKTPLTSCNKQTEDATQLTANDNSLQKTAVGSLEREIACERGKLRQQKFVLSKTKLKVARKQEQVGAAEKRVKKLREQLVAVEKILASSKKQLHNLRKEMLSLTCGIQQQQKAIGQLEVDLCTTRKNLASSISKSVHDSENFLPMEISSVNSGHFFFPVTANNLGDLVTDSYLSTGIESRSRLSARLSDIKQTQAHSSVKMTTKVQPSNRSKKVWYSNTTGACKAESVKSMKNELKSEANAVEQHHVSCTDSPVFLESTGKLSVGHSLDLDLSPVTKSHIPVSKHQQDADGTSGVVSDDVRISPASLDELTTLPDQKIKQISHHYNACLNKHLPLCSSAPSCRLFFSDPVFCFHFPVGSATLPAAASSLAAVSKANTFEIGNSFVPYLSGLLRFRSYRFSEFYWQTGQTVTAETFSHKLDSHVPLCQFDLMGRCLDDSCPWQHRSDYYLNNRECLLDIVSYYPSAVAIGSSTPVSEYQQLVSQYVDAFLKNTAHLQLSHLEQCCRLIDRVKQDARLTSPHAVRTSARGWKLSRNKPHSSATTSVSNDLLFSIDDIPEISRELASTDDARYWMVADTDQVKSLEKAVGNTPADDSLWIKLAYAKMTEMRCFSASHDEYISYGLNVLTHAVEANPSNSNLWRHYLDLYMERSHAEKDISSLFEQAIQYAPSYEFFWRYLQLPISFSQKMDICKRMRQYLCSPMCPDGRDVRSHHLLETVLYQAALCATSGHFKNGLQVLQAIVQSKPSVIWLTLMPCDRIVIWLSFIYLYECRQLPEALFSPANSNPGSIVQKEPFVIPFRIGVKTRISYETLLQLFQSAFSACDKDIKPSGTVSHNYDDDDHHHLSWLSALYRSRILLELACHSWLAAIQLTETFLQQCCLLVDVWIFLVQLIIASMSEHQTVSSMVADTVEQALSNNTHSMRLFPAGIYALIECGDTEGALSLAERCPISLYEVDELDSLSLDPNLLYCCLLGQPVPLTYKVPALRPSVSRQFVSSEQANLWLCYCLLLDLQGCHSQATETYRLALKCLTSARDMSRLWLAFLRRSVAVMSQRLSWLSPGAISVDQRTKLWHQFEADVEQALVSVPVRRTLPHSSQTWDDYTAHNDIIQLHISCLADADVVQGAYEKYLRQMPANAELALTAIDCLLKRRDAVQLCLGLSLISLHSCPRSAGLWNVALRLSQRSAHVGLARVLHARATAALPYSASLWKTYIISEVVNRSPRARMEELVDKCQHLQVNVAGFVENLLK